MADEIEISVTRAPNGDWVDADTGEVLLAAGSHASQLLVRRHWLKQQVAAWTKELKRADAVILAMRGEAGLQDRGVDATGQVSYTLVSGRTYDKRDVLALQQEFLRGEWTREELDQWASSIADFKAPPRYRKSLIASLIQLHTKSLPKRAWVETDTAKVVHGEE